MSAIISVKAYEILDSRGNPTVFIEDGLDDEGGDWQKPNVPLDNKLQFLGGDIFVTQVPRFQRAIDMNVGNASLINLNQVGTATETSDSIEPPNISESGAVNSILHGETPDDFIDDLAVFAATSRINTGLLATSERVAKYNHLICVEKELSEGVCYEW